MTWGLTIGAQIERMLQLYPDFRVESCDWAAIWTGQLRPIRRPYTVRLSYVRRFWIKGLGVEHGYTPIVRLLKPALLVRHPLTGGRPEHLYWDFERLQKSHLCLYDPVAKPAQWIPEHFIADSIVPWTVEWLACYEIWLATGKWEGGGRHVVTRSLSSQTPVAQPVSNAAQPALLRRDAFHRIGREIGTFASLPLLAAASTASSMPMCWPRWDSASWAAKPSHRALISSLVNSRASSYLDWPRASPFAFAAPVATEGVQLMRQAA